MGILPVTRNGNLLSSKLWYMRRFFSSGTGILGRKTQQTRTPRVVGDLKPRNKSMLLIQQRNRSRSVTNYSLLSTELNSWKLDSLDPGHQHAVSATCNGLVLLLLHQVDIRAVEALWNPKTNEIISVPRSHVSYPPFSANEPNAWSSDTHGFGFDPVSQDHKVIKFLEFEDAVYDRHVWAGLYSMKTDSWKEIYSPYSSYPLDHISVHINGVIYWATIDDFIVSFDFASEEFSSAPHIPLPGIVEPIFHFGAKKKSWLFDDFVLVEFDGLLAVVVFPKPGTETGFFADNSLETEERPFSFEIWVWKDESWSKVVSTITIDAARFHGVYKIVTLFNNDTLVLRGSESKLLLFNWKTSVLEIPNFLNAEKWSPVDVFPYVPI